MRRIIFMEVEQYIRIKCISTSEADVILITKGDERVIGQVSTYPLYAREREMLEKSVNELLPDNQELPIIIDGSSFKKFFKK